MRLRPALAAIVLCLCAAASAQADDAAVLYDPATVTTVDLKLSDAALQALRDQPKEYVEGQVIFTLPDSTAVGPYTIGVKLKGNFSFRPIDEKSAFKLKFAEIVKKQKILGLKGVTLNNMVQDKSMIRETTTYSVFRAASVPAPRTGYAYVRVNGGAKGIYLNLEPYDEISLDRLFPTTQHLYEGEASADATPQRRGAYKIDEGDEADESDLDALIAQAADTGGDWSDGMEAVADLDEMTKMWAGESWVAHWDSYSSYGAESYLPNNYYIHSDEAGVFRMLPSGADQSLANWRKPIGEGAGFLFQRCLADESCTAMYRAALKTVSSATRAADIGAKARQASDTVVQWRTCPAFGLPTQAEFNGDTSDTYTFLRNRRAEVAAYLGEPAPTALVVPAVPAASTDPCPAPAVPVFPEPTPSPSPSPSPEPSPSPSPEPSTSPSPEPIASASPTPPPESSPAPAATAACVVPRLRGNRLDTARRKLARNGCRKGLVERRRDGQKVRPGRWRVMESDPGAGGQLARFAKVDLVLVPRRVLRAASP